MSLTRKNRGWKTAAGLVLVVIALLLSRPLAAEAQWQVKSADGTAYVNLGFLVQPRIEFLTREDTDRVMQNIYLRRARIILGGRLDERTSFFFDTESAWILKGFPDGPKQDPPMKVLDFFGTRELTPNHRIDVGLILTPACYNHLQSAASLLALDYGSFTFAEAESLQTRTGRDPGVQARGLLADKLIEYRVGIFEGLRGPDESYPFRFAGRVALYPFQTAGSSMFYSGTAFGAVRTLSIGVAADLQRDFQGVHGDIYYEQPLSGGNAFTAQADFSLYEGATRPPRFAAQSIWMGEVGFLILDRKFGTYLQASQQDLDAQAAMDRLILHGGFTWFLDGHRQNLKLGVIQTSYDEPEGMEERPNATQYLLQYQLFYF
jgi:hypothetical protein